MNKDQAKETAQLAQDEIAKLASKIRKPSVKWAAKGEEICGIEIWSVNPQSGNTTLYTITEYAPDLVPAHIRKSVGKANKRDEQALALRAAKAAVDAE